MMIVNKIITFGASLILIFVIIYSNDNINVLEKTDLINSSLTQNYYNYDDVILVINNNSQISKGIGNYFKIQRNIKNIIYLNTVDEENVDLSDFDKQIRFPIENFLISNNLTNSTNYIVTTKGLPLKIIDIKRSVDSELTLILGPYEKYIGADTKIINPYYTKNETFSRNKFDIYLVTRLTGYNYISVKNMIDRSVDTTNNGKFVLDISPAKDGTTYRKFNDQMRNASYILKRKGYNVTLDNTTTFITRQNDVLGYVSWGSNDPNSIDHAKPHNMWVPGAIAETAVSSSAGTFDYPIYGQSLIADIIEEGATGAKGYTYEPYLDAVAQPDILFDRYTDGYNLAESYYMASRYIGWTDVVVGDPKTTIIG